jgi:hypothetical protein
MKPMIIATFWGTSQSPASSGDSPWTICMYIVDSSEIPAMTTPPSSMMLSAELNVRLANRHPVPTR